MKNACQGKKKGAALVLIIALLASVVLVSGCVSAPANPVKSTADVSNVVTNISSNVENIGSTLEDIDRSLGGK